MFSQLKWKDLLDSTVANINELSRLKGGEYAGDDDRLANFRRNGLSADVPMELIWRVYASKHWDAIMQYEFDIRHGIYRERAETILGRADDLIVYLILFKAIYLERQETLGVDRNR
jgi:hypothetical protein